MKIKRVIKGEEVQIELTADETAEAYLAHEHHCDCEYVRNRLSPSDDERFASLTDEAWENAVHEIAYEKRRQEDKYCLDEWAALDEAKKLYIKNHFAVDISSLKPLPGCYLPQDFSKAVRMLQRPYFPLPSEEVTRIEKIAADAKTDILVDKEGRQYTWGTADADGCKLMPLAPEHYYKQ